MSVRRRSTLIFFREELGEVWGVVIIEYRLGTVVYSGQAIRT